MSSIDRVFKLAEARGNGGSLEVRIRRSANGDSAHKWKASLERYDAEHAKSIEAQFGETPEKAVESIETVLEKLLTRDAEGYEASAAKVRATLTGSADPK